MTSLDKRRPGLGGTVATSGLVTLMASALVITGLYFGRDLLVPLVLAVLLAFVLAPVVRLLRSLHIARAPAVLVAVVLAFALLLGIGLAVSRQATVLAGNLPEYQLAIRGKVRMLRLDEVTQQIGMLLRGGAEPTVVPASSARADAYARAVLQQEPSPLQLARSLAEPLLKPLATTGIVIVFTIFVLLYREDLRDRLIRLAGSRDLHRTMAAMNDAAYRLSRYFLAQVALNASYGLFIGTGLWLIGLPTPVLWGILAGVMRFVPFVGTPIAVIPPILLAMAVDPGWSMALYVLALFLLSAPLMGQALEPLLYSHSTGLSPISVILAATFWAFMWGPVGLLLATPLTVCLVVLGRHVERLEFLDVMLGDRPPLRLEETFYQRALEGDADGLVAQAKQQMRLAPLATYYDEVAMRGLVLAQSDWAREVLEPERLDSLRHQIVALLDDLDEMPELFHPPVVPGDPEEDVPVAGSMAPSWQADGAVLFIAGRGQFDDLTAEMAAQIFRRQGFGARAESNSILETSSLERLDPDVVRLCCLSVLEEGSSAASVRHFVRRLRRRLPEARVIIGLWHAPADSTMLSTLRAEGPGETITTSLREAATLSQAVSAWAERTTETVR
ncbi:AI-2E family transporter [Roseomonas elaeocarpi]|uniref:AI-2E family transporter n=1 Tax=Roseomonas elaeocarpi TaxID=907779 RepID=A0ABV6JQM5_9PROT